ncbi:unnamed protein product [Prorocentrum cordatum]|uniref:Uncharacterized protein n=1 Tax=Prorocentrum cordatum TaxID=2364126 RepID=A0ABN9SH93_9DINO|nr:unnamed protein product [Polarella glacialis]
MAANSGTIPAAPDQHTMVVAAGTVWKNVSSNNIECRTEPDVEKKAGKTVKAGETIVGVMEVDWLKTEDGLFLPAKHPVTGSALFELAPPPAPPSWKNVSGRNIEYRTEPDMRKKAGMTISPGHVVAGVLEGGWLKTTDGLYLPATHPTTGAGLLAPAQPSSVAVAGGAEPPGAPPGGAWTEANYIGPVTLCIYCFCFWPIVICPIDSKQVYRAPDGKMYNPSGKEFDRCLGGE